MDGIRIGGGGQGGQYRARAPPCPCGGRVQAVHQAVCRKGRQGMLYAHLMVPTSVTQGVKMAATKQPMFGGECRSGRHLLLAPDAHKALRGSVKAARYWAFPRCITHAGVMVFGRPLFLRFTINRAALAMCERLAVRGAWRGSDHKLACIISQARAVLTPAPSSRIAKTDCCTANDDTGERHTRHLQSLRRFLHRQAQRSQHVWSSAPRCGVPGNRSVRHRFRQNGTSHTSCR